VITGQGIRKTFHTREGDTVEALAGVDVDVEKGEVFVLLGPSGSGKTTLLRCVAGLERPDEGELWLGDKLVFSKSKQTVIPPEKRNIGMVFQSYAIWPHLTVAQNIGLPLSKGRVNLPKHDVAERVRNALGMVGLEGMESRPAPLLSGGQQQRVALARAMAIEPEVMLMDEPLSNLDARLRQEVRTELRTLVKKVGATVLYVTHDQEEAMHLADRIAVMHQGQVLQTGSAEELYVRPADAVVAQFFGQINWIKGEVATGGAVDTSMGKLHVESANEFAKAQSVNAGVRPEDITLSVAAPIGAGRNVFMCEVLTRTFLGNHHVYTVQAGQEVLTVNDQSGEHLEGSVHAQVAPDRVHCFASGPSASVLDPMAQAIPRPS
jgi:iron(III) transport system ATP-binding protein